jgi:hypothetical protein
MEEESKLHLIEPLSEESGKHHEMVIVNPHIVIIWANDLHDFVSENLVDRDIGLPVLAVEATAMVRAEWKQVVEKRPQHLLAKPMIESGPEVLGEESRHTIEILKKSCSYLILLGLVHIYVQATDIDHLHLFRQPILELPQESSSVPLEAPALAAIRSSCLGVEWQHVCDDEHPILF